MIEADIQKITSEQTKGAPSFLKYINENYTPAEKKIELTDEMLEPERINKTMVMKFSKIFDPSKNMNEPR